MALRWVTAFLLTVAGCATGPSLPLDMATTTSVQNSGLLDAILPHFGGASVQVHAAGSGRALAMLADGAVDLVISHAPDAEAQYLRDHQNWQYRKLAFNRFVVVGPANDPAGVRNAASAVDAFRRIAASKSRFVSRGDGSGTHEREDALWRAAGVAPGNAKVLVSGGGMALALRHADDRQAYTLTDQATLWQIQGRLQLVELYGGDPLLLNTYAVLFTAGNAKAERLAQWLTSGGGRERIAAYRIAGREAFAVWPSSCRGDQPTDVPCVSRPGAPRDHSPR